MKNKTEHDEIGAEIKRREAKDWPQDGDAINFINGEGGITTEIFNSNQPRHIHLKKSGLLSRTAQETIRRRDKLYLLEEMRIFADFVPDWEDYDQSKCMPRYCHEDKEWDIGINFYIKRSDWPVFKSVKDWKEAKAIFGERMEVLL